MTTSWARSRASSLGTAARRGSWPSAGQHELVGDLARSRARGRPARAPRARAASARRSRPRARAAGAARSCATNASISRRVRRGREQRLAAGDDAHGVEQVGGLDVLEQEARTRRRAARRRRTRRARTSSARPRACRPARGSAVIRRVASSPSMRGIRTSIRTTSGRWRRASSTASPPSAASPTTSMSGCAVEQRAEPRAHERLVVGEQDADHAARPRRRERQRRLHAPAAAGRRPGRQHAAERRGPLAHPAHPGARAVVGRRAACRRRSTTIVTVVAARAHDTDACDARARAAARSSAPPARSGSSRRPPASAPRPTSSTSTSTSMPAARSCRPRRRRGRSSPAAGPTGAAWSASRSTPSVARRSVSASPLVRLMCSSASRACSVSWSSRCAATPACTLIATIAWATTSCTSRAIRSRSSPSRRSASASARRPHAPSPAAAPRHVADGQRELADREVGARPRRARAASSANGSTLTSTSGGSAIAATIVSRRPCSRASSDSAHARDRDERVARHVLPQHEHDAAGEQRGHTKKPSWLAQQRQHRDVRDHDAERVDVLPSLLGQQPVHEQDGRQDQDGQPALERRVHGRGGSCQAAQRGRRGRTALADARCGRAGARSGRGDHQFHLPEQRHQRRHEQRADDERVDQHAGRGRDADLLDERDRARG